MPKVTGFQKQSGSSQVYLEYDNGESTVVLLYDGILETYMENYQLMPGDALTMICLDTLDDTIDVPPYLQPGMRDIVDEILAKSDSLVWDESLDRNEVLAQITVAEDTAPELSASWRLQRIREEEVSKAYARRQEELLADEFMGTYKEPLPSYQIVNGKLQRV